MTIKTCGPSAGQAAGAVRKYIHQTGSRRVLKEHEPNDGLHLEIQSPEYPMTAAINLADHFDIAVRGWLAYDLGSSRFSVDLDEGGKYWLEEEEVVICCYKLLWSSYYLEMDQKRAWNPNISRVTEVVEALKALRVSER